MLRGLAWETAGGEAGHWLCLACSAACLSSHRISRQMGKAEWGGITETGDNCGERGGEVLPVCPAAYHSSSARGTTGEVVPVPPPKTVTPLFGGGFGFISTATREPTPAEAWVFDHPSPPPCPPLPHDRTPQKAPENSGLPQAALAPTRIWMGGGSVSDPRVLCHQSAPLLGISKPPPPRPPGDTKKVSA